LDTSRDLPIKKAMSAYVLFGNELREKIIRESDEPLKVTEIVKRIAKEWTVLTKKEKSHYKDLAKLDKARFDQELKQLTSEHSQTLKLPKKPLTPYMLFVQKYRQEVATKNPDINKLHIMKIVGDMWKNITGPELEHFRILAKSDL